LQQELKGTEKNGMSNKLAILHLERIKTKVTGRQKFSKHDAYFVVCGNTFRLAETRLDLTYCKLLRRSAA